MQFLLQIDVNLVFSQQFTWLEAERFQWKFEIIQSHLDFDDESIGKWIYENLWKKI